jgi:hypothetical protein
MSSNQDYRSIDHLLMLHWERNGRARVDVYTMGQIARVLDRAARGDKAAVQLVEPLLEMLAAYVTERPPCFVCRQMIDLPAGIVLVRALADSSDDDPAWGVGGIVCNTCARQPATKLRTCVLAALGAMGITPSDVH